MATIVEAKNAGVSFDGEAIVKGVTFSLDEGESLAIIGPNGAGKTVFLRALLGAVPHDGEIVWAGARPGTSHPASTGIFSATRRRPLLEVDEPTSSSGSASLARKSTHVATEAGSQTGLIAKIGYVPQKIDADRHLPINFINLLAAKAAIIKASQKEIDEIVAEVGLDKAIMTTPVGHLSGGQFQRALIAFALLGKPNVIILDEPTASIDKPGEERMYELVHRLQDDYGITVISVSHDLSFVSRYATKVLAINKEEICFGTPDDVLTPDALDKLYGGPMKHFHTMHEHK